MALSPPLKQLFIETDQTGFYSGFNTFFTLGSKILIGVLILWAAVWPDTAGQILQSVNTLLLSHFGHWYMYVVFFYIMVCVGLALWRLPAA